MINVNELPIAVIAKASRMSKSALVRDLVRAGVNATTTWSHDELVKTWLEIYGAR